MAILQIALTPAGARGSDLVFMYSDNEPYIVSTEIGLSGFLADYIRWVAEDADITPHWSNVPWANQLATLKRNPENICAITLFKTPEREKYLRFTAPVGSEGRFILLSVKHNARLLLHQTFGEVINDPSLQPVLQTGTYYNRHISTLLEAKKFPTINGSTERIVRRVIKDNSRYYILSDIRALQLLRKPDLKARFAVYDHFSDITEENFHYIGCSLATDEGLFTRLNDAIKRRGLAIP